jgi:hypothetical protein
VDADSLRLAELTSALSLATDLSMGQPLEHGVRTANYVSLLRFAGCTAEAHLDAELFGDEIAARTR